MVPAPSVTGVILAGGKSRRMGGRPKALLPFGGKLIIERVVETLTAVFPENLIVTDTPDLYAFLGLPMLPDLFPDHGSLGGIYSGLRAASGEAAFAVACDMPFLHAGLIRAMVERAGEGDVVIPNAAGELQTLHALYGKRCLGFMETLLRAHRLKIVAFFPEVLVVEVSEADVARFRDPSLCFMNVNTPEELELALRRLRQMEGVARA
jgi:molybdopterin-guanine dinucleotide biosynthesis protein A